jgi:hypothetical protein
LYPVSERPINKDPWAKVCLALEGMTMYSSRRRFIRNFLEEPTVEERLI